MISVVIPVYNAEAYIESSLKSICDQTERNLEILVCDDASTDLSYEKILEIKDARIRVLRNKQNIGYLKTINLLFANAKGDFIAFQDADDISDKRRLEIQLTELDRNPEVSLIGSNFSIINEKGKTIRKCEVLTDRTAIHKQLKVRNPFQKPSILFRRKIYDTIGGFREEFLKLKNISEDFDWLLRASMLFHFANVNYKRPLYHYRSVSSAMTKSVKDVDQLFGQDVVLRLYQQRLERGTDDIDDGKLDDLKSFIEKLKKPYLNDSSLFFRKRSESLVYFGLYGSALQNAFAAFLAKPTFSNFRLVQYCFRKFCFS